jgi:hypothetical protein
MKKKPTIEKEECKFRECTLFPISEDGYCAVHDKPYFKERKKYKYSDVNYDWLAFRKDIWDKREHKCFVTSLPLDKFENTVFFKNMFAHVLRKSAYPRYRFNPDNIVLLHPLDPDIHTLFDNCIYDAMKMFEKRTKYSFKGLFELEYKLHDQYREEHGFAPLRRKVCEKYLENLN